MIDSPRFSRSTVVHAVTQALNGALPEEYGAITVIGAKRKDGGYDLAVVTNVPDEDLRCTLLLTALRENAGAPRDMPLGVFIDLMRQAYKDLK